MLLALDTSTKLVGVCLYDGVQVLSERVWKSHNFHTVELAPAVADIIARSGSAIPQLEALAVAIGPGSFTGLRIGLALAKGIALMNHIPIMGIPTLDILASAQPVQNKRMVAVLQAGRGRLAAGWYKNSDKGWITAGKPEVFTPMELKQRIKKPTLVCGELDEESRRILRRKHKNVILASPANALRRPGFLAELGWQRWLDGDMDDPATLAPIYLHHNRSQSIPG